MRFGHLEIFVRDPVRSMEFYRDVLGFELGEIQHERFVWMTKNHVEILLRPGNPPPRTKSYEEASMGIVLYTDRLADRLVHLREHGVETGHPKNDPKCYAFTDPDGNWIQLVDPTDM